MVCLHPMLSANGRRRDCLVFLVQSLGSCLSPPLPPPWRSQLLHILFMLLTWSCIWIGNSLWTQMCSSIPMQYSGQKFSLPNRKIKLGGRDKRLSHEKEKEYNWLQKKCYHFLLWKHWKRRTCAVHLCAFVSLCLLFFFLSLVTQLANEFVISICRAKFTLVTCTKARPTRCAP